MSKSKVGAVLCGVLAVVLFMVASAIPAPPKTVGANGEVSGTVVGWSSILAALGGGSTVAATMLAFMKEHQAQIIDVAARFVPGASALREAAAGGEIVKDSLEVVQAGIAYSGHRDDKAAQYRFVHASVAELSLILTTEDPALATPINALMVAVVNHYFPVPVAPKV